jgi:pyruvate,water dikinase
MPPLAFAIAGDALAQGLLAAAHSYDLPVLDVRVRRINTYRYQAAIPFPSRQEEADARGKRSRAKLRDSIARLGQLWTEEWLPEITRHLAYWEAFDLPGAQTSALLAHLDGTCTRAKRMWEIHFLLHYPMHRAIKHFTNLYRELFGGAELDAYRLLQGFDNRTLQMGRALWELSRRALGAPAVLEAIRQYTANDALTVLAGSEEGRAFLGELAAYLEEYGCRREKLSIEYPSWSEDPVPVVQTLAAYLAQPHGDPHAELDALADARERWVAGARESLRDYPRVVIDEFEQRLTAAQDATVLMEDHNYWIDFRGLHQVRRVFLEFGRRLAASGALEAERDVFYLTLDELRQTGVRERLDWREVAAGRCAELDRCRGTTPPAMLGTQNLDSSPHRPSPRSLSAPSVRSSGAATEPDILRGSPGSPGRAWGPARVVRSLGEAAKLQPGDVLVARTASSSWMPLFATAAATVIETGGLLSHCAVVAREYGIPAVLGIRGVTELIQDGQMLEVDGDAGVVRVGEVMTRAEAPNPGNASVPMQP